METKKILAKGELMEELLRNYFLSLGYYVVRAAKFTHEDQDVTDIDLFLYGRSSTLTRERINVDIKNKKSPQTFERVIWANGLMKLLHFDSCIVATTDTRSTIRSFAKQHKTTLFDGAFLARIRTNTMQNRLSEEDLTQELIKLKSYKSFQNKDWKYIYEISKSRLITEQDFSGFNSTLDILNYFIEKSLTDSQKRLMALRMSYIILSHLLLIIDFICKDVAFLEPLIREQQLADGFTFGNLGKQGVEKFISMAAEVSGNQSANRVRESLENVPTKILSDFFSKNENMKNNFLWSKELESLGFSNTLVLPDNLDTSLKGVLSMLLDFLSIDRKKYFEIFK